MDASQNSTPKCPGCGLFWPEPNPRWDEFGACFCGVLLAIQTAPYRLRQVTEDDLDELAVEDRFRLYRFASHAVEDYLNSSVPCPACGSTGVVGMHNCSQGMSEYLKVWRGIDEQGHAAVGPCGRCQTPLTVVRTLAGNLVLEVRPAPAD